MPDDTLPIELECFLLRWGIFEPHHAPGYRRHADVYIPEEKKPEYVAWKPSYPGEEPPF